MLSKAWSETGTEKMLVGLASGHHVQNRTITVRRHAVYHNPDTINAMLAKLKAMSLLRGGEPLSLRLGWQLVRGRQSDLTIRHYCLGCVSLVMALSGHRDDVDQCRFQGRADIDQPPTKLDL